MLKPSYLLATGMLILALQPLHWLFTTWISPAYQSDGIYVALLVFGLLVWSFADQKTLPKIHLNQHRIAISLLLLSTLIRLLGQVFDVNTIGALALVVDMYALGILLSLDQRRRALSPFWLAVLFAFSLPLEQVLQRLVGYALQHISAVGACQVLGLGNEPVVCEGVNILLAGQEVLVDLPCSGARGLLQLLVLFSAIAVIARPCWWQAAVGLLVTVAAAWLSNVFRIVILALGIAYSDSWQIDVVVQPYHDLIGLLALLLGLMPILLWATHLSKAQKSKPSSFKTQQTLNHKAPRTQWQWQPLSVLFVGVALLIIYLPAHPVDVARPMKADAVRLPLFIDRYAAHHQPLSRDEHYYFSRYGGAASKAQYGQFSVLKVSSTAPLRHLHAPETCLRGAGHKVQYLNQTQQQGLPTAFYQSTDPKGNVWNIRVTFMADDGSLTTNISEVIWHWLQRRNVTWSMLQRIAPAEVSAAEFDAWDQAIRAALDL